jgi:hypothetical protein
VDATIRLLNKSVLITGVSYLIAGNLAVALAKDDFPLLV